MRYAVLIYDKPGTYETLAPDELERVMAEDGPITQDQAVRAGAQMQPVADDHHDARRGSGDAAHRRGRSRT